MSIRWIKDGEPHSAEVYNRPLRDYIQEAETTFAKQSLNIEVSNGLSGGGNLVGDVVKISANDATTQQKGVVRFATLEEANEGTPGVVVSPDVVKTMGVGLGMNQRWVDVTKDRESGVPYLNTTGQPIQVSIGISSASVNGSGEATVHVDGVLLGRESSASHSWSLNPTFIVPPGSSYVVTWRGRHIGLRAWAELRNIE